MDTFINYLEQNDMDFDVRQQRMVPKYTNILLRRADGVNLDYLFRDKTLINIEAF